MYGVTIVASFGTLNEENVNLAYFLSLATCDGVLTYKDRLQVP